MPVSRRELLSGALLTVGGVLLAGCTAGSERVGPGVSTRHAYGSDRSQFGDLYRPSGVGRAGVVVIIHGGFWLAEYDLALGAPLAADLAARGYTAFNLEYRRVGNGGGWPSTLQDVSDGIDLLADLDVDASRVVVVGHSAGGQLAAWAAGRAHRSAGQPGHDPKVPVTAVVSQAGVLDLAQAQRQGVGGSAVVGLLGGTPSGVAERYAVADPIGQVPLTQPVLCVHSRTDGNVPFGQSTAYVTAATAAGARARLIEVQGDHFTLIDPASADWAVVIQALPGLLAISR